MRQRKAIAADEDAATNSRVAKSSINRCTFIPSWIRGEHVTERSKSRAFFFWLLCQVLRYHSLCNFLSCSQDAFFPHKDEHVHWWPQIPKDSRRVSFKYQRLHSGHESLITLGFMCIGNSMFSWMHQNFGFCLSYFRGLSYVSWFPCVKIEVLVHILLQQFRWKVDYTTKVVVVVVNHHNRPQLWFFPLILVVCASLWLWFMLDMVFLIVVLLLVQVLDPWRN